MQVILLERIERLGQMGDEVSVKPGFARNFLLPKGKALRASDANRKRFENERAQLEARNLELKSEAEGVSTKLDGESFVAIRQAGDSGQLYGSVSPRDIAELLTEGGFTAARGQIVLDRPIKTLGLHDVRVALHPEVTVSVTVNVARTEDEAERQARGEDVTIEQDLFDDDDEAVDPDTVFEEGIEAADEASEDTESETETETETGSDSDEAPTTPA